MGISASPTIEKYENKHPLYVAAIEQWRPGSAPVRIPEDIKANRGKGDYRLGNGEIVEVKWIKANDKYDPINGNGDEWFEHSVEWDTGTQVGWAEADKSEANYLMFCRHKDDELLYYHVYDHDKAIRIYRAGRDKWQVGKQDPDKYGNEGRGYANNLIVPHKRLAPALVEYWDSRHVEPEGVQSDMFLPGMGNRRVRTQGR